MPENKADTVVFNNRNFLRAHKKIITILIVLLIMLLVPPMIVFLMFNRQSSQNEKDAKAVFETMEVNPNEVIADLNSDDTIELFARVLDENGNQIKNGISYKWSISSSDKVGELINNSEEEAEFLPKSYGCGQIIVTAIRDQQEVTKTIQVTVSDGEGVPDCLEESVSTEGNNSASKLYFESIKLHGIGQGGDNSNANLDGNLSPKRITRDIEVFFEDNKANLFLAGTGEIIYSSSSGMFSGTVLLDDNVSSGEYLVKIKSPQYLRKQVPGIISINSGDYTQISDLNLTTGDIDDNNSLDIKDYNLLIDCYSDLLSARNCDDVSKKTAADLSDDGLVNSDDYNLFLRELSVFSGD